MWNVSNVWQFDSHLNTHIKFSCSFRSWYVSIDWLLINVPKCDRWLATSHHEADTTRLHRAIAWRNGNMGRSCMQMVPQKVKCLPIHLQRFQLCSFHHSLLPSLDHISCEMELDIGNVVLARAAVRNFHLIGIPRVTSWWTYLEETLLVWNRLLYSGGYAP